MKNDMKLIFLSSSTKFIADFGLSTCRQIKSVENIVFTCSEMETIWRECRTDREKFEGADFFSFTRVFYLSFFLFVVMVTLFMVKVRMVDFLYGLRFFYQWDALKRLMERVKVLYSGDCVWLW